MQRLVVLALALCLVFVSARPRHHLSSLENDLADLERGLDEVQDFEEDEDAVGPILVGLDCGSSGTKVLFYAAQESDCPGAGGGKLCDGVKYTPTMSADYLVVSSYGSAFDRDSDSEPNRVETTSLEVNPDVPEKIVGLIAMATAGNRIINARINETAWTTLENTMKKVYPSLFLTGSVSIKRTIPGTHEAWYEMKTNQGNNFISMGGASAQFGVHLKSDDVVTSFITKVVQSRTQKGYQLTVCNNQNELHHFITVVADKTTDEFEPISITDKKTGKAAIQGCKTSHECRGLVSWLSSATLAGSPECPTIHRVMPQYTNHWAGGTNGANSLFYEWVHANEVGTHCFGESEAQDGAKCAAEVYKFSTTDRLMNLVRFFMLQKTTVVDDFSIMASLVPSIKEWNKYGSDTKLTEALQGSSDDRDTLFFAMWGAVGLVYSSGVLQIRKDFLPITWRKIALTPNKANWMHTAASFVKYDSSPFSVNCDVPFKAESYKDKSLKVKDCTVYLDRELE